MYFIIRHTKCQELFKLFEEFCPFSAVTLSAISIYHESFYDASIFLNFFKLHCFLIANYRYK